MQEKPKKKTEKEPKGNKNNDFSIGFFSKKVIERIIICILLALLAFFFVRVAIWEHNYYKEKEGSTRATATSVQTGSANDVDETPVTEEQIREHVVPANDPRYLSIEKLGIKNARVLNVGLTKNGELATPYGIFDVGWYGNSSRPGQGGTMVIDGHNGGPNVVGVFKYLDKLFAGDKIEIERGDGEKFTYEVVDNKAVSLDESDKYMQTAFTSPYPNKESLSLITCTGEWSQLRQTYLSRQFVRAVLVQENS